MNVTVRDMPGELKTRIYKEAGRRQAIGDFGYDKGGINAGQIISEVTAAELGVKLEEPPEKQLSKVAAKSGNKGISLMLPETMFKMMDDEELRLGLGKNKFILHAIKENKTFKLHPDSASFKDVSLEKMFSYSTTLPLDIEADLFKEAGIRMLGGEIGLKGGPVTVARLIQEKLSYYFKVKLPDLTRLDKDSKNEILVSMRLPLQEAMNADSKAKGMSMNKWLLDVLDRHVPK